MRRRPGRSERGAAAVELAIVLPLLLLFIGGIVDFGRYFYTEIQLTNAAREGARAAVVSDASVASRITAAAPGVPGMVIDPASPACAGAGTEVTVTVTDPDFEWILLEPAMAMVGGSATSLPEAKSTAVMRCES